MTVDQAGNVYVANSGNNRVEKFSSTGTFMQIFSTGLPNFINSPNDVAVDAVGNVYIADTGNNRVLSTSRTETTHRSGASRELRTAGSTSRSASPSTWRAPPRTSRTPATTGSRNST